MLITQVNLYLIGGTDKIQRKLFKVRGIVMARAFLVVGVESSGTRLVTKLLIEAGCAGDAGHVQRWDSQDPGGLDPIVWRRSVPHAGVLPRFSSLTQHLLMFGYQTTFVVITRDWFIQSISHAKNFHELGFTFPDSLELMKKAYRHLLYEVSQSSSDFILVNYESLVAEPELVASWICRMLKLKVPSVDFLHTITNENIKHTKEVVPPLLEIIT